MVWRFSSMLTVPIRGFPPFNPAMLPSLYSGEYRYVDIQSADGTVLNLLHLPVVEPQGTVLIVHGLGDQKESFLEHASHVRALGYGAVLLDMRAHGQSGGDQVTMGYRETQDVSAGAQWCMQQNLPRPLVVWGLSLGATSSLLAAAAREPEFDGVIAESPYGSLAETSAHHAWLLFKIPRYPIVPLVLAVFRLRTGISAGDIDAYPACSTLEDVPVLFVAGGSDPRMPPKHVQRLADKKPGEKRVLIVPNGNHANVFGIDTRKYMTEVTWLLERARERVIDRTNGG